MGLSADDQTIAELLKRRHRVPPRVPPLFNLRSDLLDAIDNRRGTAEIADRAHET